MHPRFIPSRLFEDVGTPYIVSQLCIMGFATGILDAVSFPGQFTIS